MGLTDSRILLWSSGGRAMLPGRSVALILGPKVLRDTQPCLCQWPVMRAILQYQRVCLVPAVTVFVQMCPLEL